MNGTELLPSDMAGFGFDNNADVLSITPALMSRYIAAATKISRARGRQPRQPSDHAGLQGRLREPTARAHERGHAVCHAAAAWPSGTRSRSTASTCSRIRLKRNGTVSTIEGIDEDEHEIELRVDHALVKQFTIGGKFKGPDPGVLIAVPEDDVERPADRTTTA